jgi:hypothetical protein
VHYPPSHVDSLIFTLMIIILFDSFCQDVLKS